MSIQSEINRIKSNIQSAFSIITAEGVTVASGATSDDLPDAVTGLAAADIDGGSFGETNTLSAVDGGTF